MPRPLLSPQLGRAESQNPREAMLARGLFDLRSPPAGRAQLSTALTGLPWGTLRWDAGTGDWSGQTEEFRGAERLWRFHITRGWRRNASVPLRWSFSEYSPVTLRTGVWRVIS
jgi:hypothetical protein